jgi:hypothetical protein
MERVRWGMGRKEIRFYVPPSIASVFIGDLFGEITAQFSKVRFKYEWFDLSENVYLGCVPTDGSEPDDTFISYVGVIMFDHDNNRWEYAEPEKGLINTATVVETGRLRTVIYEMLRDRTPLRAF